MCDKERRGEEKRKKEEEEREERIFFWVKVASYILCVSIPSFKSFLYRLLVPHEKKVSNENKDLLNRYC